MKKINIYNHKGGVGKTTIAVHLANKLNQHANTLVIELDDQANVLINTNIQEEVQTAINASELYPLAVLPLVGNMPINNFIYERKDKFDVIINNELNGLEAMLKEDFFKNLFTKIAELNKYEYIIIDNPPSRYELVIQALKASTDILVPFDCEDSSTQAVIDTLTNFKNVGIELDKVRGIIPNKYLYFHQELHNQNIKIINNVIDFNGSKIKLYDIIKNSKKFKDINRSDEYPNLLKDIVEDLKK